MTFMSGGHRYGARSADEEQHDGGAEHAQHGGEDEGSGVAAEADDDAGDGRADDAGDVGQSVHEPTGAADVLLGGDVLDDRPVGRRGEHQEADRDGHGDDGAGGGGGEAGEADADGTDRQAGHQDDLAGEQ